MPYGLKNAPRSFQRIINNSLHGLIGTKCFVYIDDVIVFVLSLDEHIFKLKQVFNRLCRVGFKLQPAKCEFFKNEIVYLGHKVTSDGLRPLEEKTDKIANFPRPNDKKSVQSFLGLCTYYMRIVQ